MRDSSYTSAPEDRAMSLLLGALLSLTETTEHPAKGMALGMILHGQARITHTEKSCTGCGCLTCFGTGMATASGGSGLSVIKIPCPLHVRSDTAQKDSEVLSTTCVQPVATSSPAQQRVVEGTPGALWCCVLMLSFAQACPGVSEGPEAAAPACSRLETLPIWHQPACAQEHGFMRCHTCGGTDGHIYPARSDAQLTV